MSFIKKLYNFTNIYYSTYSIEIKLYLTNYIYIKLYLY